MLAKPKDTSVNVMKRLDLLYRYYAMKSLIRLNTQSKTWLDSIYSTGTVPVSQYLKICITIIPQFYWVPYLYFDKIPNSDEKCNKYCFDTVPVRYLA
jgi:predicted phosphoadenosine phosphosulfate sulfurtransferase